MEKERTTFHYEKCNGMSQTRVTVDTDWYEAHKNEANGAELEALAFADKENSHANAVTEWFGLG